MANYDYVLVGSGINSLVCATYLARKGNRVLVLERNDWLGGCIKTEELTVPGFKHEVFSAVHPLVLTSPWFEELGPDLYKQGMEHCISGHPTGIVNLDNQSFVLGMDREANVAAIEALSPGDGEAYARNLGELEQNAELVFGLLGNHWWSLAVLKLLFKETRRRGISGMQTFMGNALESARDMLQREFSSDLVRGLFAPWLLHAGITPDSPASGLMSSVMMMTMEGAGASVVKGGNENFARAFVSLIESMGGEFRTGADVEEVLEENGKAIGVRLSDGSEFHARKGVIANMTPTQLYGRLLKNADVSSQVREQAENFKYGRGMMIIHLALDEAPQWADPEMQKVCMLHVSDGLDAVSKACNEADRGLLPENGTIVVAQPTTLDPSRAPEGKWILWLQIQELPRTIKGDAAGEICIPDGGKWNEEVRESYADRVVGNLARVIPNLDSITLGRRVFSPKDLEALNINIHGGDGYSGACGLDQNFLWRPIKSLRNGKTPVKNLWHIGASTHPGPGLSAGSGFLLGKALP